MLTETDINQHRMTTAQVARMYGVTEYTVREWAKKGDIPAHKIGKKWFFNPRSAYNHQSMKDALQALWGEAELSGTTQYDMMLKDGNLSIRVEVKSSALRSCKAGSFWRFTDLHKTSQSDYYLLLGYNETRTELLTKYFIPSKELEKYYKFKHRDDKKQKNSIRGRGISIYKDDSFMKGFIIND